MTDKLIEGSMGNSQEPLPWTQLFHGFRLAVSVPQLLLATCSVTILAAGQWAIANLPFAPEGASEWAWPWTQAIGFSLADGDWGTGTGSASSMLLSMLSLPIRSVYQPLFSLLSVGNGWGSAAYAWTQLFWALSVWSIFGGAVTRIAATQYAADQSVGLRAALKYSCGKFLSFFTSPLLPGAGLLLLWLLCLLGGWIGMIPSAGPFIVGAFFFLGLLMAFVMALIVIGIVGSWPLMSATISTEGSDAFDGFSRSFSYVFSRPRHWLGLTICSTVYGVVTLAVVVGVTASIAYLTGWALSSGMGTEGVSALMSYSPFPQPRELQSDLSTAETGFGTLMATFWLYSLSVLMHGFAVSLFWSLAVIVYFLLRFSDDSTPLSEVFLPAEIEQDDLLPLVGVAASDQPVIERPVSPEASEQESTSPSEPEPITDDDSSG